MSALKFIDLFAGIGGMRLAFKKHGMECVFSSEWDKHAQATYAANFGDVPHGDITKICTSQIPDHNILVGGFPCQPFSSIGKRQGFEHETQGNLFFEIIKILNHKQPDAFLLENMPGIRTIGGGKVFEYILDALDEIGYYTTTLDLDAKDFGVPQKRARVYFVGIAKRHNKIFNYKKPPCTSVGISEFIETNAKGYAMSDHIISKYLFKKDDGKPEIVDKTTDTPVKTLVSTYHKIQRLTGTFVQDGDNLRLLSENECKAIMGFPKAHIFPVSRTQMYRQLGNSVVVPVVSSIAEQLKKTLLSNERHFNKEVLGWTQISLLS